MPSPIYLDNSTITRPSNQTISQMFPYLTERFGNPTAPHKLGQELITPIIESYKKIYHLVGASVEDDFIFTSSGAEAINHLISSTHIDVTLATGKNHFITSQNEEAPHLMAIGRLERLGCALKLVKVRKEGYISPDDIKDAITPRTALVTLSYANGLTGVINPIHEIANVLEERGIHLHLDISHVLGKLFFEFKNIKAHSLSFDGSEIHAPKGTGGLFVKGNRENLSPFILGGQDQLGKRAGALDVPHLMALASASDEAFLSRDYITTEVVRLRDRLEKGIQEGYPEAKVLFSESERLPTITTIAFPMIHNEAHLFALNRKGVYASIGGGNFQQLSLILQASDVDAKLAKCAISFSLSRETSDEEIERAIEIIVDTAKRLRKMSLNLI